MQRRKWKDLKIVFANHKGGDLELGVEACVEQLRARFEQNPEYRRDIESAIPMIGPIFKELLDEKSKRNKPTPTCAAGSDGRATDGELRELLDRQVAEDSDTIH